LHLVIVSVVLLAAVIASGQSEQTPSPDAIELEARRIAGVDAQTAALLLSGQHGGDVDGAVAWIVGAAGEDGRCPVPFVIEVDGASLLPDATVDRVAVGIFAYLIAADGEVADHISQGVVLDRSEAAQVARGGLRFTGRTVLQPGSYILSVVVRARGSDRFFLSRRQLTVRRDPPPEGFELAPVFTDSGGGWLTVHQAGGSPGFTIDRMDGVAPAALPVLVEGRPTEFFLVTEVEQLPTIDARFLDRAGRILAEYTLEVTPGDAQRTRMVRALLPVVDLPPGAYSLVLEARTRASGDVVRYSSPVVQAASDGPATWIVDRRAPASAGSQTAVADDSGTRFRKKRARNTYLEVLRLLAAGDSTAARRRLMTLERTADSHGVLRALRRIEDSVASSLAARDPKALLPVALLHHQMVRRYVARSEFVLAEYSRAVAADRAAQIAAFGGDTGFASALLVNIAGDMARTASPTLAREYLARALSIDPAFRPALLALGTIQERSSDYEEAVKSFTKLVDNHPTATEGRLRLAVNLARTGRTRKAEFQFRSVLGGTASPWIRAVATQEYAQMLLSEGRREDAHDLLAGESSVLAEDQRLRVLLAYLADGAGRPMESVEYILHIPAASSGISPRAQYTEWPDLGAEASAVALRAGAGAAMPEFTRAVQSLGGPA
jgi:tetratricopeptide (TPR) repeat protein